MKYNCNKCNKEFTQKSNYDVHVNRKKPCIEILDDIISETRNLQSSAKITPNNAKNSKLNAKITPNNAKTNLSDTINNYHLINDLNNNFNEIVCQYCSKIFARKDNLTKHLKSRCKIKNKHDTIIEQLLEDNKTLKENVSKLTEIIINSDKTKTKKINKYLTNNTSNTINTNNGQIIQNQQNINIKMVSFGEEDINKLTEREVLSILKSKKDAFINLVKLVHLNKRLPFD